MPAKSPVNGRPRRVRAMHAGREPDDDQPRARDRRTAAPAGNDTSGYAARTSSRKLARRDAAAASTRRTSGVGIGWRLSQCTAAFSARRVIASSRFLIPRPAMLPSEPHLEVRKRSAGYGELAQAAAAVRPRRLLRCVVLGAVFPPVVRRTRLRRLRAEPARPRHERRRRDAVRRRPRRLRGGRRARRRHARRRRRC